MSARLPLRWLVLAMLALSTPVAAQGDREDGLVSAIQGLFDRHSAIMLLIDPADGQILGANEAAATFYGYSVDTLLSMRIEDINALSHEQVQSEMRLARAQDRNFFIFTHRLANGEQRTVEVRSSPVFWLGRDSLLSIVTDISDRIEALSAVERQQGQLETELAKLTTRIERKALVNVMILAAIAIAAISLSVFLWFSRKTMRAAEATANEERHRLRDIVRSTGIGTWEWDLGSNAIRVNERFESLLGRNSRSVDLHSVEDLMALTHPDDIDGMRTELSRHIQGKTPNIEHEVRVAHSNGQWIWVRIRGSAVRRDDNGRVSKLAGVIRDITDEKSSEDHLFRQANYDSLTGLPNRSALLDRLQLSMEQAKRSGRPLALAFIDLDDFKAVNDRYGHDVGDELLIGVAQRMLRVLRDSDTLARIGGDEFVAIFTDIGDAAVDMALYQRILSAASEPVAVGNERISMGASIGITAYPQHDSIEADQLLRQADQAMYEAKNAGKNRIRRFDVGKLEADAVKRTARDELRHAIKKNELLLYYQPKVDMRDGRPLGAEALVRWQHPRHGLLQPAAFLPSLDSSDDAMLLGEWALRRALAQCSSWYEAKLHCPVSVNIDVRHFQRADFSERLAALLAEYPHLPEGSIELEILETGTLEQDVVTNGTLRRCRDMGIRISLDDFGTGFSSLSYLKTVPADCLKIDCSFVMSMLDDPSDLSIIKGVLGLAAAFNRDTVAEGVCSEAHGKMLIRLGCFFGQGYGIARPMPGDLLRDWLNSWHVPDAWKNTTRLPREEHLILYALVELRSWISRIDGFLEGVGGPPPVIPARNGLGSWLLGEGAKALRSEAELYQLHRCHEQITRLGNQPSYQRADRASVRDYPEIRALCCSCAEAIEQLLERDALNRVSGHLRLVANR
jgi:diguanylate cyclase (GGDEF)-like protein/PAS domain S-box-containing protein